MSTSVKTCSKCKVEKTLDNYYKRGSSFRGVCKKCWKWRGTKWREDNLEKSRLSSRKYYETHAESCRERSKRFHQNHPWRSKYASRKARDGLLERYIKQVIVQTTGVEMQQVTQEMVNFKRQLLQDHRAIREIKEELDGLIREGNKGTAGEVQGN